MMRALLLSLGALLSGCSSWSVFTPSPWPEPTGLGVHVGRSNELNPAEGKVLDENEHVYVLFKTRGGRDDEFKAIERTSAVFELDRTTQRLTALPAAPFQLDALWGAATPRGFLAQGAGSGLASFDGDAWSVLPDSPAAFRYVHRVDARRVIGSSTGGVFLLADGGWRELTQALGGRARDAMLGPWSDTAVRLVWVEPAGAAFQVCTQLVDTTSFSAMGVASCRLTQTRPAFLGDAVNGTVDDFQVVFAPVSGRGAQVWRFVNGAWAPGSFITAAALFQTPRSTGLCVQPFAGGLTLMRVTEGKATETLFTSMAAVLGCGFESPPSRDCPIRAAFTQTVNAACTTSWFAAHNVVDSRSSVFVQSLALPHRDAVTCMPACTKQLCRAGPQGLGVCDRDPVFDTYEQLPGPTSSVVLTATGLLPADPLVTFWNPTTGAPLEGFTSFVDQSSRTVVRGPPGTPVRLQLHLDGYEDREVTFSMPDEGRIADLGGFSFIKGQRLGFAAGGAAVRVGDAGDSLVLPLMNADGGVLTEVREASDGGLQLLALAAFEGVPTTPIVSASGAWVLWSDGSGLVAVRPSSGQRVVLSAAQGWQTRLAVFSGDEGAVAVPNAMGVVVFGLVGTPTERYRAMPNGGEPPQLSFDGATMLRRVGADFLISTAVDSHVISSAAQAVLSGDGLKVYTTAGAPGALTLSVQSTAAGAPRSTVATGVRAFTVDPVGSDVLFDGVVGGSTRISRASATGQVSVVQSGLAGTAESLPSGALWVRDTTSTTVFFPFGSAAGRRFIGSHSFSFDGHGALLSPAGLRVTTTDVQELPAGPGVFAAGSTRRLDGTSVIILNGGAGPRPAPYAAASAGTTVDPLFTSTTGLQSYFAPCAPVLLPTRTISVASSGAVTTTAGPSELYCEVDPRRR